MPSVDSSDDTLRRYLDDIRKTQPIDRKAEQLLFKKLDPKDPEIVTATREEIDELLLLARTSFRLGQFKLSSGGVSDYYVDCRTTTLNAEGGRLTGESILDLLLQHGIEAEAVGGIVEGAGRPDRQGCVEPGERVRTVRGTRWRRRTLRVNRVRASGSGVSTSR